ncbi:MAG: thioredoxin domain-containing protein [Bacillota bacterium]
MMKEGDTITQNLRVTNRLGQEKSPYLLQHAHNPVDWYPWGGEAFSRAVAEDKPIFLSIGYSTCHWCHVMERESFEDEEVARILNKSFIAIKVDREERPDVDHIYMSVCQALTGHGGWPLTIIMTPDKKPFFAGTYFPKDARMGYPGIMDILGKVEDAWKNERDTLLESSEQIIKHINDEGESSEGELSMKDAERCYQSFLNSFDERYGGFGSAPKFPSPHNLLFLLRYWKAKGNNDALKMVVKTLDCMYKGGIYDHIGFGFSRYSTDRKWLVPHFEKMLYDNALLAMAYMETYQAAGSKKYADAAEQIFEYIIRDMTSPDGGFYSAEDADSEGVEGKFYVWTVEEVISVLGQEDGLRYCEMYDITEKGNFEGKSIPNLIRMSLSAEDMAFAERCRKKLFYYREKRIHPFKDDKILTSWNGLMIAAMAFGGRVLNKKEYVSTAEKAASFLYFNMFDHTGRLMARYRDGETAYKGYADDYVFLIWGLIELYEATYKPEYLEKALKLNKELLSLFWDDKQGGLYMYGHDSEELISRPKEIYDGAVPSGNSAAAFNLIRLARLTGEFELEQKAGQIFRAFGKAIADYPAGYSFCMLSFLIMVSGTREIILIDKAKTNEIDKMIQAMNEEYIPFAVSLFYSEEHSELKQLVPYIENYKTVDDKATAYVCRNYACQSPTNDISRFTELLRS